MLFQLVKVNVSGKNQEETSAIISVTTSLLFLSWFIYLTTLRHLHRLYSTNHRSVINDEFGRAWSNVVPVVSLTD